MEKKHLIDLFVDNFVGLAFVQDINGNTILYANETYYSFTHDIPNQLPTLTRSEQSLYSFCEFVNDEFKKQYGPTFACENFAGKSYASVRFLIEYCCRPAILTLILTCDNTEELFNDVHVCHTKKYITPLS